MKLQGSLACLLIALCLGGGAANPLHSGGEVSGESAAHGVGDALGQGYGEGGGSPLMGSRGDVFDEPRLGEAVRSLGNAGNEIARQAEDVIRQGVDAVHNAGSWVSEWLGSPVCREGMGMGEAGSRTLRDGSKGEEEMVPCWLSGTVSFVVMNLSPAWSPLPHPSPPDGADSLSCDCQRQSH